MIDRGRIVQNSRVHCNARCTKVYRRSYEKQINKRRSVLERPECKHKKRLRNRTGARARAGKSFHRRNAYVCRRCALCWPCQLPDPRPIRRKCLGSRIRTSVARSPLTSECIMQTRNKSSHESMKRIRFVQRAPLVRVDFERPAKRKDRPARLWKLSVAGLHVDCLAQRFPNFSSGADPLTKIKIKTITNNNNIILLLYFHNQMYVFLMII